MKFIVKLLVGLVLLSVVLAGTSKHYIEQLLTDETLNKESILINIKKGTTIIGIVAEFNKQELMQPSWFFEYYLKYISKFESKYINAGIHEIPPKITNLELINGLSTGQYISRLMLTFPEGLTYKEMANIVEKKTGIPSEKFISEAQSIEILTKYGITSNSLEGYLLPETYQFERNVNVKQIIGKLMSEGNKIWDNANNDKALSMGFSKFEILTLASIIEAETPNSSEYKKISGVYHNRLKIGMLLQADPTVQYALGNKKKLRRFDLDFNNPYNTYLYVGLPPGPINNPGKGAILAALNPEKHNYLYFVAIGDGSALHNFAENFDGHQSNIAKYRKNRRQ